jgi:hypothetical protein
VNSDTAEGHWTYVINYERVVQVVGGGVVRIKILDRNCRIIKNCGATAGFPCAGKARTVNISQASPQPAGLQQPGLGQTADHAGQWLLIDATAVAPTG